MSWKNSLFTKLTWRTWHFTKHPLTRLCRHNLRIQESLSECYPTEITGHHDWESKGIPAHKCDAGEQYFALQHAIFLFLKKSSLGIPEATRKVIMCIGALENSVIFLQSIAFIYKNANVHLIRDNGWKFNLIIIRILKCNPSS